MATPAAAEPTEQKSVQVFGRKACSLSYYF